MRIQNMEQLACHGNQARRGDALQIIEAGLTACDPYYNVKRLFSLQGTRLRIGDPAFEAAGDPRSGVDEYDVRQFKHIWLIGVGKGIMRAALAVEEIFGEYLTDGEVICKKGDPVILKRIRVTQGGHPVPDEGCVLGCERILALAQRVTADDLVITMVGNGVSALLTCPTVPLCDVQEITRLIQIELGVSTHFLNAIRNHIDKLKGGKLARLFSKATMVNIAVLDINQIDMGRRSGYNELMRENVWLHNMPDATTFADARRVLDTYNAWSRCPASIRKVLEEADPAQETVRYQEYENFRFRVFGVIPEHQILQAARATAEMLGYKPVFLARNMHVHAQDMGNVLAAMANCIEAGEGLTQSPAALLIHGCEMLVSCGENHGVGGRNQECALAAGLMIAGSPNIVLAAVDTDGTDGPGGFQAPGAPSCFAGGIVDGQTVREAEEKGVNIRKALDEHNTSEALWRLQSAIHARQGISMCDLIVALV